MTRRRQAFILLWIAGAALVTCGIVAIVTGSTRALSYGGGAAGLLSVVSGCVRLSGDDRR
ncbi:MAG: hypothetical protein M3Y77_07230 [Actinomycetota bacterium]|nr:hypothetical protein [Actinomycetota bacterium]